MLIKLAALGALGYAGYRYFQKNEAGGYREPRRILVAGGPLSDQATVQPSATVPPSGFQPN